MCHIGPSGSASPAGQCLIEPLARAARFTRAGFIVLWLVSAIIFSYVVLWLGGHDRALASRALAGINDICLRTRVELEAIYRSNSAQGGAESPADIKYLSPDRGECNTVTISSWMNAPCPPGAQYGFPGGKLVKCPEMKVYARHFLRDLRDTESRILVNEKVGIPFLNISSSTVDFVLLSPIFVFIVFAWIGITLTYLRQTTFELTSVQYAESGYMDFVLPSHFVMYNPTRSNWNRRVFLFLSCLSPALALAAALFSDILDLVVLAIPTTPFGHDPIATMLALFDSGEYIPRVVVREVILALGVGSLFWFGSKVSNIAADVRNIICFHAFRTGIETHCMREANDILGNAPKGSNERAIRVRVGLRRSPSENRNHWSLRNWTMTHEITVARPEQAEDLGSLGPSAIIETVVPPLSLLDWIPPRTEHSVSVSIAKHEDEDFLKYRQELAAKLKGWLDGYLTGTANHAPKSP